MTLALDTSHGPRPGWEAAPVWRRVVWPGPFGLRQGTPSPLLQSVVPELGAAPWWQGLLETGQRIAEARYAVPPAGTYQQTGPGGSVYSRTDPRLAFNPPFGIAPGGGVSTWFLVGAGVLVVVLVAAAGRRRS